MWKHIERAITAEIKRLVEVVVEAYDQAKQLNANLDNAEARLRMWDSDERNRAQPSATTPDVRTS